MKASSLEELVTNSNILGELRNYTDWHTRLVRFAQRVADWQKEQMLKGNPVILPTEDFQALIDSHAKRVEADYKEKMLKDAVEGWVAVDADTTGNRRVSFFPQKPVRDLLTRYKYWAATRPNYEMIRLDSDAFPDMKWEDEPKKVHIVVLKAEEE